MQSIWKSLRPWGWRALQITALLTSVAAALYWYLAPVTVVEHRVQRAELVAEVMGTGTLEARVKSTISPKIAGRIHEILVDQGDEVQAGQLLFTLDDDELRQQVEIAQATTALWNASLSRLQADYNQALAVVESARKDRAREQSLTAKNASTAEMSDRSAERLGVAEAGLARALAAQEEGRKQIQTSERTHAYAEARLADTRVMAPFDGLIVKRFRDPGEIGVPGSPILTLVSTKEIWVSAWVDETEMSRLHPGQSARVTFRSEPEACYVGKVTRLGREADRETREFVVDVQVLTLPENWAIGQRAEVFIEVARKLDVAILPEKFVVWREKTSGVYVRVGSRAQWREVTLGLRGAETVEVTSGLSAEDTVVMPPAGKLVELDNRRVAAP